MMQMSDDDGTPSRFDGQVALVTGSTQGLGEAVAQRLVARGLSGLVVTGRSAERGIAVAERLIRAGCDTTFVPADLSNHADVVRLVRECDSRFGRIDVLVNAAGNTDRGT